MVLFITCENNNFYDTSILRNERMRKYKSFYWLTLNIFFILDISY